MKNRTPRKMPDNLPAILKNTGFSGKCLYIWGWDRGADKLNSSA